MIDAFPDGTWKEKLRELLSSPMMAGFWTVLQEEWESGEVYPPPPLVFRAFELTPFEETKVVLVGQDPYFKPRQANGLAFSAEPWQKTPPSLRNILQELSDDLGILSDHGDLLPWTEQGVLLLNRVLTVDRRGKAWSHCDRGWELLTTAAVRHLSSSEQPVVYLLWGQKAQVLERVIDEHSKYNVILKAAHPSPHSARRGFFGSHPFSTTNLALEAMGAKPIDWSL